MEKTTINLSTPITINGTEVSALQMREPTVEDQITASEVRGSAAIQEVTLIANLCDVTPEDIRRLTLRDYKQVQEAFTGFTE